MPLERDKGEKGERGEKGDHGQDGIAQDEIMNFKVFMAETVVYRKEQASRMDRMSDKIDKIFNTLSDLPCKERAYIPAQITAIWGFIGAIIILIINAYVRISK